MSTSMMTIGVKANMWGNAWKPGLSCRDRECFLESLRPRSDWATIHVLKSFSTLSHSKLCLIKPISGVERDSEGKWQYALEPLASHNIGFATQTL